MSNLYNERTDDERFKTANWELLLRHAIRAMLNDEGFVGKLPKQHIEKTPDRVVAAYKEYMRGVNIDIEKILASPFEDAYPGMVIVEDIPINSICLHHLEHFHGKATFGYLPGTKLVGLSKIPRLVDAYAGRPQLQERLGSQIVSAFFCSDVKPEGCGIVIKAVHNCMTKRGAKAVGTATKTISLAGSFINNPLVKQEFLEAAK